MNLPPFLLDPFLLPKQMMRIGKANQGFPSNGVPIVACLAIFAWVGYTEGVGPLMRYATYLACIVASGFFLVAITLPSTSKKRRLRVAFATVGRQKGSGSFSCS